MKKLLVATALLSTTLLSGCIVAVSDGEMRHYNSSWESTHKSNREKISNLALGTTYKEVIKQFNTPDFTEAVSKDGHTYQVLYFATNSKHSDGKVTKDECTPLVFKDKELIGFGQSAVDSYL
ncbi:DUF3192 domain-containing protein [Pseudoalteromonas luteoviolacea]|uniref:DUF3192 domain-containing protein n=1 Tax=Pseudoalteromonas luteoviolacea S4060-1 TaxID=1365257 RepID=A0A162CC91_9GAMM|nr:DUF3192 domain-containing protein [Pseudoalteromonas luteoviolacea]KZN29066.1 hypothetical protein N480_09875 [Pseudoalteromonas luteoviolacea S2607]KZN65574.1 hypothetical protein N478_20970 [Pseudoalteromonas luteoviolacea S4060-1]